MYLKLFKDLSSSDVSIAGGKGASLGELTQAGIAVPPGFVLLASVFERFLDETGLNVEIDAILDSVNHDSIHTVERASEKIKALILEKEMPEDIVLEIESFFSDLNAKYVAVRSSATAEDSVSAAWAGQLETYLNTTQENLLENIKKCWSSLFTPRAIFYRFEKNLQKEKILVAVVVQVMVESEKSGVAFSVHPVTQVPNQLIIEAGFGLGEAIVSGHITPNSYVLDRRQRQIIDKKNHTQSKGFYRAENGGNQWRDIAQEKGAQQVLSDDEIFELAELILKIEKHHGFACDIEWAFDQGKFYILQSRPITTLSDHELLQDVNCLDDEWVFMWSTTPLMPTYWATCRALIDRADVYGDGEVFSYFDGDVITTYMQKSQIDKFKREGEKYLNESFFQNYQEKYNQETNKWWLWIRQKESQDFSDKSCSDLLEDFVRFNQYARDSIAYFASTRTEFTFAAEQRLEEIIKKYFGDKWPVVFGDLVTSISLDDIQNEYLDWLQLISYEFVDQDLLDHVSKYPWLVFGQFDEAKVVEFLRNRLANEKCNFEDESQKLQKSKKILKKKHQEIFDKLGSESREAKYLAEFLQHQSLERMKIKSYWVGAYYLLRNMWLTIAEKMNLPLWDVLGFLTPDEVEMFLAEKNMESMSVIVEERKKSHALVVSDGKLKILNSQQADLLFEERIKKVENKDGLIHGQTAMLGVANGKVRKVIAGDLDMLQKSIEDFEEGEILVTTMTQPNMMVLAQKAAAIVTDEGGITSHAAIIARELKIPCVVGCLHSMQLLNDGDEVIVNANKARIEIILDK